MDLSNLDPTVKILTALAAVIGAAITAFFVAPKNVSDLGLNRLLRRKHLSELIDALTSSKDGQEKAHPLAVQAKFHAAFGGAIAYLPESGEILALLQNHAMDLYLNVLEYGACSKFVAYSDSEKSFLPRGDWTDAKLETRRRWDFFFYLISAVPAFGLIFIPPFHLPGLPFRIAVGLLLLLVAVGNAIESKLIGRTQNLLKRTREKTTSGANTSARPSGIAPEKAPGTLPEHGASVEAQAPSKP
jgi:hypothetical protein